MRLSSSRSIINYNDMASHGDGGKASCSRYSYLDKKLATQPPCNRGGEQWGRARWGIKEEYARKNNSGCRRSVVQYTGLYCIIHHNAITIPFSASLISLPCICCGGAFFTFSFAFCFGFAGLAVTVMAVERRCTLQCSQRTGQQRSDPTTNTFW